MLSSFYPLMALAAAAVTGVHSLVAGAKGLAAREPDFASSSNGNLLQPRGLPDCNNREGDALPYEAFGIGKAPELELKKPSASFDGVKLPDTCLNARSGYRICYVLYEGVQVNRANQPPSVLETTLSDGRSVIVNDWYLGTIQFTAPGGTTNVYAAHGVNWAYSKGTTTAWLERTNKSVSGIPGDHETINYLCTYDNLLDIVHIFVTPGAENVH